MIYHIVDNIYLSNIHAARDSNLVKSNKIDIVCRLSEDDNKSIYDDSIKFHNFFVEDNGMYGYELLESFSKISKIVKQNPTKNILIHCNEGKSRSVCIIILLLMMNKKLSVLEAHSLVKSKKSDVLPNHGFATVLVDLEMLSKESDLDVDSSAFKKYKNMQYHKYKNYK
jgi:hypothetical protein